MFHSFLPENSCPLLDQSHFDASETWPITDDDDDDDDEDFDEEEEEEDEGHDIYENDGSAISKPTSPQRTLSHESQTSTPARPLRTSSNMSNFVWSSTSRYRPFADKSIKKMGLIKLAKRLGDILDTSMMKARQALAPAVTCCVGDECQCKIVALYPRRVSINYLEALLNGRSEDFIQTSCSCHPHSTMCCAPGDRILGNDLEQRGLPSFRSLYLFLCRVLLDIIHECLRLRLQHRPKGEPSSLSVRQVQNTNFYGATRYVSQGVPKLMSNLLSGRGRNTVQTSKPLT